MLVNLFDVQDRKLAPSHACHIVPALKRVMQEYPNDYLPIYKYVCFTTCMDGTINPYVNLPEDEREGVILRDIKREHGEFKFGLDDPIVLDAIATCKLLYETPVLRTYIGAKKMLDKVANYLYSEDITDGKEGNAMSVDRFLTKLPEYWDNYRKLESVLKEEQSKVKGDRIIPFHQQPGYKETKDYGE